MVLKQNKQRSYRAVANQPGMPKCSLLPGGYHQSHTPPLYQTKTQYENCSVSASNPTADMYQMRQREPRTISNPARAISLAHRVGTGISKIQKPRTPCAETVYAVGCELPYMRQTRQRKMENEL